VPTITTRTVTPEDTSLLFELFLDGEAAAWARISPIDPGPVLRRMFEAQQAEYRRRFPRAQHEIVLLEGEPAGQVRWDENSDDVHIVDIGVLPRCRGQGVASAVYERIVAHARGAAKPVRSTVTRANTASVALHARAGFVVESEDETHYYLVCR